MLNSEESEATNAGGGKRFARHELRRREQVDESLRNLYSLRSIKNSPLVIFTTCPETVSITLNEKLPFKVLIILAD